MINISKITARHSKGAGWEMFGHVDKSVNCGTHTLKGNHDQNVMGSCDKPFQVTFAPWVQFPSQEWEDMIGKLFTEMAEAWNEKHSRGV